MVGNELQPVRREAAPTGLLPQQILTTAGRPCGDALVDQWGRSHPLETRTLIGRTLEHERSN